jgi:hypothetical protein
MLGRPQSLLHARKKHKRISHKEAQKAHNEEFSGAEESEFAAPKSRKGLEVIFMCFMCFFVAYPFCAGLWQTLLNFTLVPVVIPLGQGFGRL